MTLSSRRFLPAALGAVLLATPGTAQQRRTLSNGDPQALLLGYFAAAISFTPVGLAQPGFSAGGALGYIPSLSLEDRTVGFGGTKAVDANRCSVYPRLAAGYMTRTGFAFEAGYTPSVEMCDVKASVVSAAASFRFELAPTWDGIARLSAFGGSVKGDFICSGDAVANPADQTCYGGTPSSDRVAPRAYGFDFAFARRSRGTLRIEPYVILGFNRETVDLDVNYVRTAAQGTAVGLPALADTNRRRAQLTRIHAGLGTSWTPLGWLALGGELYYEPGAVLTARGSARVRFGVPQ